MGPSGAPLHTLSNLYVVPVGFVPSFILGSVLLYLRWPNDGCFSTWDELSCFSTFIVFLGCSALFVFYIFETRIEYIIEIYNGNLLQFC